MDNKRTLSKVIYIVINFGAAILLVGAALGTTLIFWALIKPLASPLFLLAIVVTTWRFGLSAGVFSTVLSGIIIDYFFIAPEYQFSGAFDDISRLIFFSIEGSVLCWLITGRIRVAEEIEYSRGQLQALLLRQQSLLEEERKRIALEIHDELGQVLTGLKMEMHFLNKNFSANDKKQKTIVDTVEINNKIKEILTLIDTTILSVRRIATELRPAILDDLGLFAAIEWQAREFQRRTGISCSLFSNIENISFNSEFSTAFFRIFQETLTNIARHANAKKIVVNLEKSEQKLILRVEDNGKGINIDNESARNSLGILGMRERARLIGGELKIFNSVNDGDDGNDSGTIVELTAPLIN